MLYGMECWASKKQHASKMVAAEMIMLKWMSGKTWRDKIRNKNLCRMVWIATIDDKMRETRFKWFGHVYHSR